MKRKVAVLVGALTIAGASLGLFLVTRPETRVEGLRLPSICAIQVVALDGTRFCSHGPDPDMACTFPIFGCVLPPSPIAKQPNPPPPCFGTSDGKRIQMAYAYTDSNDLEAQRAKLLGVAGDADRYLAGQTGQHYRFVCGSDGKPTIVAVKVVSLTIGAFIDGARAAGMTRTDRIYASMHSSGGGGTATLDGDDSPGLTNQNNSGPAYSISGNNYPTYVHEIGHNLGAVQNSAPHSSQAGHCYDEDDIMCYQDGGKYFADGGELTHTCSSNPGLFDCGRNDYFNPHPLIGNYLVTHWNLTHSAFLTAVGG